MFSIEIMKHLYHLVPRQLSLQCTFIT